MDFPFAKKTGMASVFFAYISVISVIKDIKFSSWEQALEAILDIIAAEYRRHINLLDSAKCNEYDTPIQQGYTTALPDFPFAPNPRSYISPFLYRATIF